MKIKFSNFVKLFLAGASLLAVGCTDYGQDIENLNDRIDALESDTIAALETDLDAVEQALVDAKADLQGQIDVNEGLIKGLEEDLADANAKIATHTTEIANLQGSLTALKSDLEGKIDGLRTDVFAELGKVNEDISKLNDAVSDLKKQDATFATAIAGLETAVKEHETKIENLLNVEIPALKAKDGELDGKIAELKKELEDHLTAYGLFVTEINAKVAALEAEVVLLKAKDVELEGLINDVKALAQKNEKDIEAIYGRLDVLEKAHAALETTVTTLKDNFEQYQQKVDAQLAHFAAFETEVNGKLADLFAKHDAQQTIIDGHTTAIADMQGLISGLQAEDTKLWAALKLQEDALAAAKKELQANIDAANEALKQYKAEVKVLIEGLESKIDANTGNIKLNKQEIDAVKDLVADLTTRVSTLETNLQALTTTVNDLINNTIKQLQGNLEALKGRLQSIVYVPEYTDGLATIEYAVAYGANVDATSKLLYQVHPAECANEGVITKEELTFLFQELKTRANEQLEVVDVKPHDLAKGIIAVYAKGHNLQSLYDGSKNYAVSLVFNGKAGNKEESEANIASAYTSLVAEKAADASQLTWALAGTYSKAESIEYTNLNAPVTILNGLTVAFEVDGVAVENDKVYAQYGLNTRPVATLDGTYNNDTYVSALDGATKNSKDVFKNETIADGAGYNVSIVLPQYDKATVGLIQTLQYSFKLYNVADNAVLDTLTETGTVTITKIQGHMELASQVIDWKRSLDNDTDGITPLVPTSRLVATTAGDLLRTLADASEVKVEGTTYENIIAVAPVITINGAAMATPYNVVFGGTNAAPTVDFSGFEWNKTYDIVATYELPEITVTMNVTIETKQPNEPVNFAEQTITWNYAQDKASEKGAATFRAIAAEPDNAALYADVIANGKLVSITPATGYVFTATGIEATGFAWNATENVEAVYALEDKLVTVKAPVKAVKEAFVDLTIDLDDAQWKLTKTFVDQSETAAESLTPVYDKLTNLGEISAADYLTDIFVTESAALTLTATANGATLANTKLEIAADGQTIKSVYNIGDFVTIPDAVEYTLVAETWYGQKITFNKTLNIGLALVELSLPDSEITLKKDLVETFGPDALAEIYDKLLAQNTVTVEKNDFIADEYLKAIFVDHAYTAVDLANGTALTNTKLVVAAADGKTAVAEYNYADFTTANPTEVLYKSTYTTWYGQVIEVTKKLTIKLPKYNYKHVDLWVSAYTDGSSHSTVVPTYYPELPTTSLQSYSVNAVNMNDAFAVVDEAGNVVTDLAAVGLTSTFSFRSLPVSTGIIMLDNKIQYNGNDDFVSVKGELRLVNSNSVYTVLPTEFDSDTNGDSIHYQNYVVNKYDPIAEEFKGETYSVEILGGTQTFTCNSMKQLSLKDYRGQTYPSYDLLKDGAWVIGDGSNGFANGYSAKAIYGLSDIEFSCSEIPAEYAGYLHFNSTSGIVTFNYTSEMQMVNDIKLTITAKVKYTWGERETSFDCHFIRKK